MHVAIYIIQNSALSLVTSYDSLMGLLPLTSLILIAVNDVDIAKWGMFSK